MSKSKRKMRVGIIGAGGVSKDLHLPVLINMPDLKVAWVCDKDEQRARDLSKLFKIPAVFTDIEQCSDADIVLVAIPVGYRQEVMTTIFRRGWHAFCEKPFAVTLSECDQYLEQAGKDNLQVGVALVRRYGPATILARKIVSLQYFGPIVQVWASEGMRMKRTGREKGWYVADPMAVGGGVLMETGSHLVDQMCTILDVRDFKLSVCTQKIFKGLELETKFVGTVSTEQLHDIKCAFEVSRLEDSCNGIFIQFSNLILKCGLGFDSPLEMLTLEGKSITQLDSDEGARTIAQAFFLEWKDFIDQCQSGIPSMVNAKTVRISTSLIEQCYKNAKVAEVSENIGKV